MNKQEIIYFQDELNDEFSTAKIEPRKIDENYKYIHGLVWNICSWIIKNIISMPIKIGYSKIKFRVKYVGKEKLKPYKDQGYFVYGNHTQPFADTFIPTIPIYPKKHSLIVNPENVSIKPLGTLIEMLGAIPIPCNRAGMKNFLNAIKTKINQKNAIVIYPEAHIWPYYTKIRPFKAVSFRYPVELDTPTFCMTNTYHKRGKNKVKIITYIDGPFFPSSNLKTIQEKKQDLRNQVYDCMVERSKSSDFEYVKYVKVPH